MSEHDDIITTGGPEKCPSCGGLRQDRESCPCGLLMPRKISIYDLGSGGTMIAMGLVEELREKLAAAERRAEELAAEVDRLRRRLCPTGEHDAYYSMHGMCRRCGMVEP